MTYDEMVAAEVRAEAARRRITGARLAKALDLSAMSMSRRLNGHQAFTVGELVAVAAVLGVPVRSLLPEMGTAARAAASGGGAVAGAGFEPATSGLRASACRWCQAHPHRCDSSCWCDCHWPTGLRADDLAVAA